MRRLNQRWTQSSYGFPKSEHFFLDFKTEGFFWQTHFTDYSGFTYSGLTRNYFKAKMLLILVKIF